MKNLKLLHLVFVVAFLACLICPLVAQALIPTVNVGNPNNPSVSGQPINFNVVVTGGGPIPTGTVQFKIDAAPFGLPVALDIAGVALSGAISTLAVTLTPPLLLPAHTVVVDYSGDANYSPGSGTLPGGQIVNKASTLVNVTSPVANPSVSGQSITFTAVVSAVAPGSGTPTGTVQFKIDDTPFGTPVNLGTPVTLVGGSATSIATTLTAAAGPYAITADYSGDINFNINTGSLPTQTVGQANVTTTVTSPVANPSVYGQPITFTAVVSAVAPGSGTPTGTVQFRINGGALGAPVALNTSGAATSIATTAATLPVSPPGSPHIITVDYSGDANFNILAGALLPPGQTVNKANVTVTVASPIANPSVSGQPVNFTATVAVVAPGVGVPAGFVQFRIDNALFGVPVALVAGVATSGFTSVITLPVGARTITADYLGDPNFNILTGSLPTQQVNKANTTTTLISSLNPSLYENVVNFTATVAAVAPGVGTPTGTVQFNIDSAPFGAPVALVGGVAFVNTLPTTLTGGVHVITATYSGDANFNTGNGNPSNGKLVPDQQVIRRLTGTVVVSYINPSLYGQWTSFTATVTGLGGALPPTGTVQFKHDGVNLGTPVTLVPGLGNTSTAIYIPSSTELDVPGSPHVIQANFLGDINYAPSSGSLPTQTVNKANTSTAVTSSVNPSRAGEPVTFTALVSAVAPGSNTPTGTVQFKIDGVNFGTPVTLVGGSATSGANTSLAVGTHTVTTDYLGDANFNTNTGTLPGGQVVIKADTTTAVTSSVNPSRAGESVIFTALVSAVAPGAGTPTGNVQFKIDGVNFGAPVPLVGGSAPSGATTTLTVGNHVVTADYLLGDANFNASTGTLTGGQTVNKADTTTVVTSSVNPSLAGESVTFTAVVSAVAPGAGTPTGNVQFTIDTFNFGGPIALVGGSVTTPPTALLPVGNHIIKANYLGDANFNISSGTLAGGQTVDKADTTTAVTSSDNPSLYGQPVNFTATVSAVAPGSGTPTGTVQFNIDGAPFGAPVALVGGVATSGANTTMDAENHVVTADYSGDSNFNTSSGTLTGDQTVDKADTTTAVTSSDNPSLAGQPVTFTATVSAVAPGAGTPTGNVQFKIDGVNFGTPVALVGGSATSGATTIQLPVVGSPHTVTADYIGDSNFNPSGGTLPTQSVNQADTLTIVTSSDNPSLVGQPVSFTATVSAVAPGAGTPTGTVQFKIGAANFGSPVTLVSGVAISTATATLAVGGYTITAEYSGDSEYNTSTGILPGGQTVSKSSTTTTVTSSVNPSLLDQSVSFTAVVSAVAPGAGTPTGNVQFNIDGAPFGAPVALVGGSATSGAITTLATGIHLVTADYLLGDSSFNLSTGTLTGGQTVDKLNTTTVVISSVNPSVSGQSVIFTATVTAGSGTPTGTVQFNIDGAPFGTPVTLVSGSATSGATTTLTVGNHVVTADYSDDSNFNISTGTLTGGQTVNKADTTTVVSSSINPSVSGQLVTFTATVSAVAPGAGTPTGSVGFIIDGGVPVYVALVSGSASTTNASLIVGNHTVTVNYFGDSNFNTSTSILAGGQTVNKADTTTVVSSLVNPSVSGQSVTFTATVSANAPGAGTPTGTVQFNIDSAPFGAPVALVSGSATSGATTTLTVGNHVVTADYIGDSSFNISTGTLPGDQVVNKAAPTTVVISSVNPSVPGQSVTFTVTVSAVAPGSGTPTGTVQFKIDGVNFGTPVALVGGSATSGATTTLTVGNHVVTADYSGDSDYDTSTGTLPGGQVVNKADTLTVVSSSVNPSVIGQSVTFTAVVSAVAPGVGTPTGTVQFKIDGVNFGTPVTLVGGGSANIATDPSTLTVGNHVVTADYSGDSNFNTSTGTLTGGQTVAPEFDVKNPTGSVEAGSPVTFLVDIAIPVTGATLYYKKGGEASYSSITLNQSGIAFSGNIPAGNVTAYGLLYYVDAVNGATHSYYPPGFLPGGAVAPENIPVHAPSAFAFFPTPASPNIWNMIAPNGIPDDTNLRSVVGPGFNEGSGGTWIAWKWNTSSLAWERPLDVPDTFVPGESWFFAKDGSGMPQSVTFSSTSVDASVPFVIPLQEGWNLVANPFAFPVAWSDDGIKIRYSGTLYTPTAANIVEYVSDKLSWWNPAEGHYKIMVSSDGLPMMPNQGQWLLSAVPDAELLVYPIHAPTAIESPAAPKKDMTAWEVTLSLQSSTGSDSVTAAVGKSTGKVGLNQIKSPGVPFAPYIALTRDDQVGAASMLSSDVRAINDELTWSIKATASSEMSLDWSLVNVPDDYMLSLEDQAGKVVNLRQDSAIHLGVGVHSFILKAEKKVLIPKTTKLLANYPNPFNPETWIPYELSKNTDVTIKIYASNGQLVRSLELGHKMAGFYSGKDKAAHWDGKNEAGEQVSSGIYFYNIQAGDYKDIRKMVIMK